MWKKAFSNSNEEKEIENSAKLMMLGLEKKAYEIEKVPAWVTLIKSKTSSAFYLDPKGTPDQINAIKELGFVWSPEESLPTDAERIFQTHEE